MRKGDVTYMKSFHHAIHVIMSFIWKLRHSLWLTYGKTFYIGGTIKNIQLLITLLLVLGFLLSFQNYQFYCFTLLSENTQSVKEVYISVKLVLLLDNLGLYKSLKYF